MKALISLLSMTLLLVGCAPAPTLSPGAPAQALDFSIEEYRIGVGDNLRISVWRNDNLSAEVPVRPDGKISMPLVGDVMAADRTAEELAHNITGKLEEYIRNPQVTVIVTNPSSSDFQHRVRVTGAVGSPMSMPYRKGMTVLDLVLMAGGPNEFAAANRAVLYRHEAGEVKVYPVRLNDILRNGRLETNYTLLPSDIVTVPERRF